jgi:hypothetical protein
LGILARKLGVRLSIFLGSLIYSLGIFLTNWTIQVIYSTSLKLKF